MAKKKEIKVSPEEALLSYIAILFPYCNLEETKRIRDIVHVALLRDRKERLGDKLNGI